MIQQLFNSMGRRALAGATFAAGVMAALLVASRRGAVAQKHKTPSERDALPNFAFGLTDEGQLSAEDMSLPQRARDLIRIGTDGIAKENTTAMIAFFHPL